MKFSHTNHENIAIEHSYAWSSSLFTAATSVTPQLPVKTRRQENKRIFNLHAKPVSESLLRTWLLPHMSHDLLTGVPPGFA